MRGSFTFSCSGPKRSPAEAGQSCALLRERRHPFDKHKRSGDRLAFVVNDLMARIEKLRAGCQMKPDDQNDLDWPLIALTVIVGIALVAFVAYTLFVYLHLSSIESRLIK